MGAIVLLVLLGLAAWALICIDRTNRKASRRCPVCGGTMVVSLIVNGRWICAKCYDHWRKHQASQDDTEVGV